MAGLEAERHSIVEIVGVVDMVADLVDIDCPIHQIHSLEAFGQDHSAIVGVVGRLEGDTVLYIVHHCLASHHTFGDVDAHKENKVELTDLW